MHKNNPYKELIIWKKSLNLCIKIYFLTKKFPKEEIYSLTSQIRRCAVSIPSNIAEGKMQTSDKSFSNFLRISLGSLAELETQLVIALKLNYISESDFGEIELLIREVEKMINVFLKKLIT